jgi:3-oxoacyl-[acyl-carrier protein] reductase
MATAPNILLAGKTAIVTGGTRGIGAGISKELALRGANIAMVFVNPATADAAAAYAKSLEGFGGGIRAVAINADLSNAESPAKIVRETLAKLKVEKIDILGMLPL